MQAQRELSHADSARVHAMRRAWQRHGLAIAQADLTAAERRIAWGDATLICKCVRNRQAYRVKIKDSRLVVIFDLTLEAIVTVLPSESWIRELKHPARRGAQADAGRRRVSTRAEA